MTTKKSQHQLASPNDLAKILETITGIDGQIKALEKLGPSREERIVAFNRVVDRYSDDQRSFEEGSGRLSSNGLLADHFSPEKQVAAFMSFFSRRGAQGQILGVRR